MARTRHRRELKSEINIVPLLDVLLVLLLIFMATAPIISQSVKVELPDAAQAEIVSGSDNPPIILEVAGVGQYSVIIDGHREELLPPEQIAAITKAALVKNPQAIFLIGGAKDVPYEEVIKALNILHQAGIKSVGFMTQPI
ncbi:MULTISPECIES: colicin uptake protein TolR [Arsenophonus]|jgi:biopolymer transport protein TolR|uniref:colicin uptake protein TolR n=1 Tax=Arsenophonus TaxID=637 RepID=UPI0015D77A57|nr:MULTISPECIES: colicin uptake protein TolR [Arsenophonus]UBX28276.1 colicin uptake protein TolR [Arsenophonus apicola]